MFKDGLKWHEPLREFSHLLLPIVVEKEVVDIGKTLLVEMDIDTGDSPPIASKPYTLSLKHYDWVQKEITTL